MGPKKVKEVDEDFWKRSIENTYLDELDWKVKVIIIESAGSEQDRIYLNKFETIAAEERRFVIKNISKTETLFMINQLGGEKKVKDDAMRIFEEGQLFLRDKKDLPSDLLALTIKHLIIKMKDEYIFIKRQRLQVKEGMRRESATMVDRTEVRGTVNVKVVEAEPEKVKKGKNDANFNATDPEEGKKYNTQLRIRGEEWRDKVYVDDFPIDGPNLYVAVTGFQDPYLSVCLVKIGIPLTAIVQIRIDCTNVRVPSTLSRNTKRGQSQTELLMEKSLKFWSVLQQLRIQEESRDYLKNTAFIIFNPPYRQDNKLSGNAENIYDELSFLMYDVQDLSRQHLNYLDNIEVIEIPNADIIENDMSQYFRIIKDLPLESVTVFSVLDSLLQVVSKNNIQGSDSTTTNLSTAVTMNVDHQNNISDKLEKAQNLVKQIFNKLTDLDEDNMKCYRPTYGEEFENYKDPIIISYGDLSKNTTFHLGNINLDNIVYSMLVNMPVHKLWHNLFKPQRELEAKINYHVNILLSCFARKDIETSELTRLLYILACRKLYNNRSSNKKAHVPQISNIEFKKVYLKRSILAEPLPKSPSVFYSSGSMSPSFPSITKAEDDNFDNVLLETEQEQIRLLFDCPDISELVSAAEINTNKPIDHIIDEFEYFEDFYGISSYQILQEVFNKYNCVDYKYCEVTDSIVLMFFNSHDKDGVAREEWRNHLPTPVCLQDFFDFVLEENYEWILNQETKYDLKMELNKQSECKDLIDVFATMSCTENQEHGTDLLMEGSLKHQELLNCAEEQNDNASEIKNISKGSPPHNIDSEPKKAKTPASSTPKNTTKQSTYHSQHLLHDYGKPFSGYNLGDRRFEILGKDSYFFSKDDTKISTAYYMIIPLNMEYVSLSIAPGNGNSVFRIHRALGDFVESKYMDISESFRISSKDDVTINIVKRSYEVPVLPSISQEDIKKRNLKPSSDNNYNSSIFIPQLMETKTFYGLTITWPNGLIVESVHKDNSSEISHVKQYYLASIPNLCEDMRCISLVGEVVIFKTNGNVEVLRCDGTHILITKCGKRVVIPDLPENLASSASTTDKNKNKGKPKPKDKPSRSSSKSSKLDDSFKTEIKLEYELYIDEYEIIETNGNKQKYADGTFEHLENLLVRTATEYNLREIFSRRMDGTSILLNNDGVQTVTFHDNTRIITNFSIEEENIYTDWTDEERVLLDIWNGQPPEQDISLGGSQSQKSYTSSSSFSKKFEEENEEKRNYDEGFVSVTISYTVEHPNFSTVTVNPKTRDIKVISPNNTSVNIQGDNYDIKLDDLTRATFDGKKLRISYEACRRCSSQTTCDVNISDDDEGEGFINKWWLKLKDSFCKQVIINEEGGISIVDDIEEECIQPEEIHHEDENEHGYNNAESSFMSHAACRGANLQKKLRFFILHRDLTSSELVHRSIVEEYKKACRWQPWCSMSEYDSFGDHRRLLSILSPVHLDESEKWLMDSKNASKPHYLAYKDLRKDEGKGFYHWMRPYKRFEPSPLKPANVLPPRLPRAFILRTLEQQWNDKTREVMKGGKELLEAILKYRYVMEADCADVLQAPIVDHRTEGERRRDNNLQAFAHRLYGDLKNKLEEDVQGRMKADITTKAVLYPDQLSLGILTEEESVDEMRVLKDRESVVQELEEIDPMSPNLRRYWKIRSEEEKEEQFYKYLLRQGNVPPYFRNVLGGAIWWEVMRAAGGAVDLAEHVTPECPCEQELIDCAQGCGSDQLDG